MENRQKTFSARYNDPACDEGVYINDVVAGRGIDAHFAYPDADVLWNDFSTLMWHQDEPFASSTPYAQWEVYKLVRQHDVTVALDGQGSDEILAGYGWYYSST